MEFILLLVALFTLFSNAFLLIVCLFYLFKITENIKELSDFLEAAYLKKRNNNKSDNGLVDP